MSSGKNESGTAPGKILGFYRINFRITLLFSLLFALTSLLLFGAVFLTVRQSIRQDELRFISHKLLAYWARTQTTKIEDFVETLDDGALLLEGTPFFLRISDAENRTVFFSYPQIWKDFFPDGLEGTERSPEGRLVLRSPKHSYSLEAAGIPLSGDYFLQIGISTENREKTLALVVRNFALLFVPLLAISFLIGSFLTAKTLNPIHRLTDAAKRIVDTGDLAARIPESPARDELRSLVVLFNRMLGRIETLVQGMRGTLDTVAHDLRTPLTRFRGIAELALDKPDDAGRCREALAEGIEESEKILTLLDAFMDLTEAETGTLRLDRKPTEIDLLVREVAEMYSFVAEERNIRVETDSEEPITAEVDAPRLKQAVGNLLDNAVKYSPDGSRVFVGLRREGTDSFRVDVRDEGPGIPEDELPHIWERLYRGKGVRSKPGLGLGLSLVKAIAEVHGGHAEATNNEGKGASFTIRCPLSQAGKQDGFGFS